MFLISLASSLFYSSGPKNESVGISKGMTVSKVGVAKQRVSKTLKGFGLFQILHIFALQIHSKLPGVKEKWWIDRTYGEAEAHCNVPCAGVGGYMAGLQRKPVYWRPACSGDLRLSPAFLLVYDLPNLSSAQRYFAFSVPFGLNNQISSQNCPAFKPFLSRVFLPSNFICYSELESHSSYCIFQQIPPNRCLLAPKFI